MDDDRSQEGAGVECREHDLDFFSTAGTEVAFVCHLWFLVRDFGTGTGKLSLSKGSP